MNNCKVTKTRNLSESIVELTIMVSKEVLDSISPGCHVKLHIPTIDEYRHYSCVMLNNSQTEMILAIKTEVDSLSGEYIKSLYIEDTIDFEGPFNKFPDLYARKGMEHIVISGGIGITPLTGILLRLKDLGEPVILHYYCSSVVDAVYVEELIDMLGGKCVLHPSNGSKKTVEEILTGISNKSSIYVCGSDRLLNNVLEFCDDMDIFRDQVVFESFGLDSEKKEIREIYEVEEVNSGVVVEVLPHQSLLEALESSGLEPLSDCRRGECGLCAVEVIDGDVEHHDFIMTADEALTSSTIYTCVSHANCKRLKISI